MGRLLEGVSERLSRSPSLDGMLALREKLLAFDGLRRLCCLLANGSGSLDEPTLGNPYPPDSDRTCGVGLLSTDTTDLIGKTRSVAPGLNWGKGESESCREGESGSWAWRKARLRSFGFTPKSASDGRGGGDA